MKTVKQARRKASVQRVVHTTVGDLIASLVDTVGMDQARDLLTLRSPLQKWLRQRLIVARV